MKLALLPGDGIGPEIVAQARKVLQRLGLKLEMREAAVGGAGYDAAEDPLPPATLSRSEEHTSELQSQSNLVCRLLLEKKKQNVTSCDHYSTRLPSRT